jgi:AcrR family transcriptional regulator
MLEAMNEPSSAGAPSASATTHPGDGRQRRVRSDSVRNENALVRAVGELLKEAPESATMPTVAERAGLSLATAYRYFPTLDSLHRRFMLSVVEGLLWDTQALTSTGQQRFEEILRRWLKIVDEYGPAMVLVRSREGFLTRLEQKEPQTVTLDQIWGSAIRGIMDELGIARERYPLALALYNALLNSREILDVRFATGMDDEALTTHLTMVFRGAVSGLR